MEAVTQEADPISKEMDAILWQRRKTTRAADGDLIFTAERGARIDQKNLAASVLKPALADAGVSAWVESRRADISVRAADGD